MQKYYKTCIYVLTCVYASAKITAKGDDDKVNVLLLELKMKQKHLTNEDIAKALNIDPATFYRKKRGYSDFSRTEMQKIRSILNLTSQEVDSIFFDDVLA